MDHKSDVINGKVSSEMYGLKAEIVLLNTSLMESKAIIEKMRESVMQTIQEKYELIDQISSEKLLNESLKKQLSKERELFAQKQNSIWRDLIGSIQQMKIQKKLILQLKRKNENIKKSLLRAKDTIFQMGMMYLRMQHTKNGFKTIFYRSNKKSFTDVPNIDSEQIYPISDENVNN